MTIRPFTPADYEALSSLGNVCWPEYPGTADEARHQDATRDSRMLHGRFLADLEGETIGVGAFHQFPFMHHPRKFEVELMVNPAHRRRGIGSALYSAVMDGIAEHDPLVVRSGTREDIADGVRFLERNGFEEEMRTWESRLEVSTFDLDAYRDAAAKSAAAGVRITTLRELESDPDRDRKLHDLNVTVCRDVPAPDAVTDVPFESFVQAELTSPNLLPDAYFIALDGDQYVGLSALWASQGSDDLYTGLTGVRRSHRRLGIALALKIEAIRWARTAGRTVIKTWNESNNRPMLSINEALGFVKQPAWISYRKTLREETDG